MSDREAWDVEPREDGWAVQREGTDRADSKRDTQEQAIARAVELAASEP
jgi:hypothetical protein